MTGLRKSLMGGKDVLLLGECLAGALNQEQVDPEKNDEAQRRQLLRTSMGNVVLGDLVLAIFDLRDDMRALKGALTK